MIETEVKDSLLTLMAERKYQDIKAMVEDYNEVDLAELLDEFSEEEAVRLFRLVQKDKAATVFSYMERELQESIIEAITDRELNRLLDELFLDDTVDILEEMPANVVERILKHTDAKTRKAINQLLRYPESSAGSLMNTELIAIKKEMTVGKAIDHIRRRAKEVEEIHTIYVTDKDRVLEGTVTIRDIFMAEEDDLIEDIMDTAIIYVGTMSDQEEVAAVFSKYGFVTLPVVDKETRLVGIITVDDAVAVIEEETTEDFEILAAVTPSDDSYVKTGVLRQFLNRIPWLLLLMLSATFTGAIISSFEKELQTVGFLVAFIPMLMGTGGNCGSQSSILVIRSLALGDIHGVQVLKVWWKEVRVALLCGVVLAAVNFLRIYVTEYFLGDYAMSEVFNMAMAVSISLLLVVVAAKSIGCLFPIGVKKLGLDPAIMASPFITSVLDSFSLIVYFQVAKAIFKL